MSLVDKLPSDVCRHIFEYDITYRDIFKESLNFIEHALPVCTCRGLKDRRIHSRLDYSFFYTSLRWCWNACPKHNPSAFDRNGMVQEYYMPDFMPIIVLPDYYIGSSYEFKTISRRFHAIVDSGYWINMCTILYYLSEWLILRRLHNNVFRKGRCKKQSWSRFMDMNHNQRNIVA